MNRQILLVEPNYRNKYPPMGLMKLATYYKRQGDSVKFFKGDLKELALDETMERLMTQLRANDSSINWGGYATKIREYVRRGVKSSLEGVPRATGSGNIARLMTFYHDFFRKERYFEEKFLKYDRVGITTLFTFYWDITIETINFAKRLCKDPSGVMVGGVLASLLPDRVEKATEIRPFVGTLHTPGELDPGNTDIIDELPLDYSILEEIDYQYPASDAYFAYMTRGCVNRCAFCAVPTLEPEYVSYLPLAAQLSESEKRFGAKRDLLLMDNNVLASPKFDEIIDEIKAAGFAAGATYCEPRAYDLAIANLKSGLCDRGYIRRCVKEFARLLAKLEKIGAGAEELRKRLEAYGFLSEHTASKELLIETYDEFRELFDCLYSKKARRRTVDFNQGIDSRLVTDENMARLAEIAIKPVRIAFDHWSLRATYEKAVRIAAKHGHANLSNYILYNFKDKPVELYRRLKLNTDLVEELGVSIYSFPMKYHPIRDPKFFSNRDYVGAHWNRKFIRAIQSILNATRGKVGHERTFFEKAFGKNEQEFELLLYMPEEMIIHRLKSEKSGATGHWRELFQSLTEEERAEIFPKIESGAFEYDGTNKRLRELMQIYREFK